MCDKIDRRTSNDIFNKPVNGVRECKWCHQKFENITGSQLANHVRWCEENPDRGKDLKEKIQAKVEINMLEQFGEYREFIVKCDNPNGNNLNGISRDHMFSVKDGFVNYIDPIFISHPANCRLIRHNENVSKLDKSLFDRDELLKRIIEWDQRNGKFNTTMNYESFNNIFDWKIYFTKKCRERCQVFSLAYESTKRVNKNKFFENLSL